MLVTEVARPLEGLRVVDCTVERGELTGRLLADLGAEVVKVEPPGGSPARTPRAGAHGRVAGVGGAQRRQARASCSTSATAADRERFHTLLDHADVLVTSDVEIASGSGPERHGRRHACAGRGPPAPRRRRHHPVRTRRPVRRVRRHRRPPCRRAGASRSRPACPSDTPLFPPGPSRRRPRLGHGAFAALCALYQREQTGAGQFVELSANEAVALMRRLGAAQRRAPACSRASRPPRCAADPGRSTPCSSARTATCAWSC